MARDHSPAVRPRPTRSPIEPAAEATSKTTAAPPPEATVSLKLQGLIYRPSNASALIDGQTYFVGDNVGKAKVVAIEPSRVLLQQDGVVKILELGK